jgi:hypothetical protein
MMMMMMMMMIIIIITRLYTTSHVTLTRNSETSATTIPSCSASISCTVSVLLQINYSWGGNFNYFLSLKCDLSDLNNSM